MKVPKANTVLSIFMIIIKKFLKLQKQANYMLK